MPLQSTALADSPLRLSLLYSESPHASLQAYVDMLSKSLAAEYAGVGITVQNQAPLFVATKLAKIRRPRLDAPSPKVWVHAAIRDVGYAQTSCPYW